MKPETLSEAVEQLEAAWKELLITIGTQLKLDRVVGKLSHFLNRWNK